MLTKGDKLIVTKDVASFLRKGDIAQVVSVNDNGVVSFAFGDDFMHMGIMTDSEYKEHFEKLEDKCEEMSYSEMIAERVDKIISESEVVTTTVFDKCVIVACKLPNGFVTIESYTFTDPKDYDEELAVSICMDKIFDSVWSLEEYLLREECDIEEDECPYTCNDCPCECDYDEFDECLDTDLDCDDCEDFDCPYRVN